MSGRTWPARRQRSARLHAGIDSPAQRQDQGKLPPLVVSTDDGPFTAASKSARPDNELDAARRRGSADRHPARLDRRAKAGRLAHARGAGRQSQPGPASRPGAVSVGTGQGWPVRLGDPTRGAPLAGSGRCADEHPGACRWKRSSPAASLRGNAPTARSPAICRCGRCRSAMRSTSASAGSAFPDRRYGSRCGGAEDACRRNSPAVDRSPAGRARRGADADLAAGLHTVTLLVDPVAASLRIELADVPARRLGAALGAGRAPPRGIRPRCGSGAKFLFATCQVGAEAALKAEMAHRWPGFRFAYSRPGFLTFKLPAEFAAAEGFRLAEDSIWEPVLPGRGVFRSAKRRNRTGRADPAGLGPRRSKRFWRLHVSGARRLPAGDHGFEPGLTDPARKAAQSLADSRPAPEAGRRWWPMRRRSRASGCSTVLLPRAGRVVDWLASGPGDFFPLAGRIVSPAAARGRHLPGVHQIRRSAGLVGFARCAVATRRSRSAVRLGARARRYWPEGCR